MSATTTDLCELPAAVSPDGTYNFIDPPSLKATVYSVSIILTAIATLLTAGRIWVNRRKLVLGDYVSFFFDGAGAGFLRRRASPHAKGRYYRHQWDVRACWMDGDYMMIVFFNSLFFGLCLGLAKVSIFLLYLQLFAVQRGMRLAVYLGLFFTIGLYITFIPCVAYFEAPHIGDTWTDLLTNGQPNNAVPWSMPIGAGSILIDIYMFVLPIPTLMKQHTSTSKRLQMIALFGTALFGVVASIVAVVYRVPLLAPDNLLTPGIDNTWHVGQVYIANLTECMVAISVNCLPACVNLFRHHISETQAWKSARSIFTAGTRHHSESKVPSAKLSGYSDRSARARSRPRNEDDSYQLMERGSVTSPFDKYAKTDAPAGVAVSTDRVLDPGTDRDRAGIRRTVDIYQQEQRDRESPTSFA